MTKQGKKFIDAYMAATNKEREVWWWVKLIIFAISGYAAYKIATIEELIGIVRLILAIYTFIAVIGVLFFLSLKFVFKNAFPALKTMLPWWPF